MEFRASHIGFIFQQFNLLPALTAAENAAIPLVARGESLGRGAGIATEWLKRLGLTDCLHKFPSQLSGGQQQRVAIARALVHCPRLIVCDEPTAALDAHAGKTVMQLLREVAVQPNRAVLVVTHDNRIFPYADRIMQMADGCVTEADLPHVTENF